MIDRPLPRTLPSLLLALLSGLLIGLGQAPWQVWPATMVGLAMFTWLVAGRQLRGALGLGFLSGVAMHTLTVGWIDVLGIGVAAGLIGYSSLWYALAAVLIALVTRLRGWPIWVAAVWVGIEWCSGRWPFGGFAWTRLAFTTLDQPMSNLLPYLGAGGVGLTVAWLSQLLLSKRLVRALATIALVFAVGSVLRFVPLPPAEQHVTVANVQPNVNRHEYGGPYYARAVTNNALSSTVLAMAEARAQGREVDFVLWPESAVDIDPLRDETSQRQVDLATKLAAAPVLVGAVTLPDDPPDHRQTSGIWWDPTTGPGDRYHKRNLVPFGEWIPYRDLLLPLVPLLEQTGRQSWPGEGAGTIEAPVARYPSLVVGDIICFELAYDDTVYDVVRAGAQVVVSQSNENTYAGTPQVPQQLAMNRVRAIELRREIVVSTLNSISATVDARGEVLRATDEFTGDARITEVPLRYRVTPATTVGPALSLLGTVAAVLAAVGGVVVGRRAGRLEGIPSRKERHAG